MVRCAALLILGLSAILPFHASLGAEAGTASGYDFHRDYKAGQTLKYEMTGDNQGWHYQVDAASVVKQDETGEFYEEIAWSNLRSNAPPSAPMTLSPTSLAFRQKISLGSSAKYLTIPDLSKVQPFLIGPIADLLTFYSDLFLAKKQNLTLVGHTIHFKHGTPNSWADGQHVVLGEDSIDFDLTLLAVDKKANTASLLVRHGPPLRPQVKLPPEWMSKPVSDTPNNWVQVVKENDKYLAEVGKETFEVRMVVDTRDGKILTAHMENPVTAVGRECEDAALLKCGEAAPRNVHREVSLRLIQ